MIRVLQKSVDTLHKVVFFDDLITEEESRNIDKELVIVIEGLGQDIKSEYLLHRCIGSSDGHIWRSHNAGCSDCEMRATREGKMTLETIRRCGK